MARLSLIHLVNELVRAEWLGNRPASGQFHLGQKEKAADQGVEPPASSCGQPLKRTAILGDSDDIWPDAGGTGF
jgi:hypothetical protein